LELLNFSEAVAYAATLFIIANPIGNSPAILTIIKDYPLAKQKQILLREGLASFFLALFFQYAGDQFLNVLHLEGYTVSLCGGILLFFVAFWLIFPNHLADTKLNSNHEPFVVPIATPLLAGPALLTTIMLFAQKVDSPLTLSLGLAIAWLGVAIILWITPYLQKLIGNKGITALEQLMGMILSMIAIGMINGGLKTFIETFK